MSSKRKPSTASTTGEKPAESTSPQSVAATTVSTKRQRVSRACDQCRSAREKCDGIQPQCYPCVSHNRPCTYTSNPKKRGVQTGYIRTLEIALAWLFDTVPGTEDALSAYLAQDGGEGHRLLTGQAVDNAERLHKRWRRSKVHKRIDRVLSRGSVAEAEQDQGKDLSSEGAGAIDREPDQPNSSLEPAYATPKSPGILGLHSLGSYSSHLKAPYLGTGQQTATRSAAQLCQLKLPSNHWRLLDIYFSYTHSWLPILEKRDVFQACYLYSEESLVVDIRDPTTAVHAEVWAALALGAFQDAASSKPTWSNTTTGPGTISPGQIYATARSLIPSDEGPFRLQHARAAILLALVNIGREDMTSAWMLIGHAVRIFIEVAWYQNAASETHKHQAVLMACFILDTFVSVRYGRPPHLRTEYLTTSIPALENDLVEWEPWTPCDGFGSGDGHARSARNPAFGASIFSQIYKIFKIVNTSVFGRQTDLGSQQTASIEDLRQGIDAASPLARAFDLADGQPSSAPSLYVLRVVYLWAQGILGSSTLSQVRPLLDILEAFQMRFGLCGGSPMISSCLSSMGNLEDTAKLEEDDMERIRSLRDGFSFVWRNAGSDTVEQAPQTQVYPSRVPAPKGQSQQSFVTSSAISDASIPFPTPSSSSFFEVPMMPMHLQTHPGDFTQGNNTHLFTPYLASKQTLDPPDPSPEMPQLARPIDDIQAAAGPGSLGHSSSHMIDPSFLGIEDSNSLDYDAILDDLALIDPTDDIDMDPLFMSNLGFGPDCDLNDIMR